MKMSFWKDHGYHHPEKDDENDKMNECLLDNEYELNEAAKSRKLQKNKTLLGISLALSVLVNLVLLILKVMQPWRQVSITNGLTRMYSPADDVIKFRNQVFDYSSTHKEDDWAGPPTPERNARWQALHWVGDHRLTKSEASRLTNKTATALPDSDDYIVVFSVFHDLHCLDTIRISFSYMRDEKWNSTYNPYTLPWPENFEHGKYGPGHAYHCFNSIRQALMCASDVTPEVFQYDEEKGEVLTRMNVLHQCKDFDAIHDWALSRMYTGSYEPKGHRDHQGICGVDGCRA